MNEFPLFRLKEVHKRYGGRPALDLKSLEVQSEEVCCLVGPTGSGKSTLLRLLAGLESPTSGRMFFRKKPFRPEKSAPADRRRITMVFQRPMLLNATVSANVEYGLRLRGKHRHSQEKVNGVLERFGMAGLAGRAASTLSGGQVQLVALARALVLEPEVLLLDEPTANLDPAHVALIERVIQEEFRQKRMSIVWATHNLFQAKRVADRIALLLGGQLVEEADAESFFNLPSDPRTLDFVEGRMIY